MGSVKFRSYNWIEVIEDDKQYSPASIAGTAVIAFSLAEGELQTLFDAFSVGVLIRNLLSDARWAILFVAVGDILQLFK